MQTDIKTKIQIAIKDMESKIARDSKHIYVNNETGEYLQGVSSVSSIVPKDWLASWGAKEAVKFLGYSDYNDLSIAIDMQAKIISATVSEYVEILKEAKGAHARKNKKAMVDGTKGHKWLEDYVLMRINGSMPMIGLPTDSLLRPVNQFLEWESKEVDYWIANEALVCRLDKDYAGQLDAIYMSKSGRLCLVDFKFASHVSTEHRLQTAGYCATFEPYDIKFDCRVIIRLPKTLESESWNSKTYKYEKIPNNIEVFEVPSKYEPDRDAFFASLVVKAWINYVEKK